ncbi:MAG: hypothetical protein FWC86_04315, partial [Coriobacteriia bacterium]|nr:hypothetical protein [Coriobacteriia bacterium]
VGIITALYGALLACFQSDLKKVLAFSTISQLGFLFTAIGVGSAFVAVFHLTTHAFFKALLFLAAGIIIHATGTQDMNKMGGLLKRMPITFIVFTIGAFALAGVIPLAGFFSKDEIFKAVLHFGHDTGQYLAFAGVVLVGMMTAFYVVKSWLSVFFGRSRAEADKTQDTSISTSSDSGKQDQKHEHREHPLELAPVIALAIPAALAGFAVIPLGVFLDYPSHWPPLYMIAISTAVMLLGAIAGVFASAYAQMKRSRAAAQKESEQQAKAKDRLRFITAAADQRFYLDAVYDYGIIKPYFWLSRALWQFDEKVIDGAVNAARLLYEKFSAVLNWTDSRIIDGMVNGLSWTYVLLSRLARVFDVRIIDGIVNGIGQLSITIGGRLRTIQSGDVQWYQRLVVGAVVIVLGILVILYAVTLRGA